MMSYDTLQTVVKLANLFWWSIHFALASVALAIIIGLVELARRVARRMALDIIEISRSLIYQLGMDLISLRAAHHNMMLDTEQRKLQLEEVSIRLLESGQK